MMRINKYLARCGVASRRTADELVAAGRVMVNGRVVDTPGVSIDEAGDEVRLDGKIVRPAEDYTYVLLNKPSGYVTTLSDPQHRRTVIELLAEIKKRIYPVGRLDLDTQGVLLFTDDGELAHRLAHPRYNIKKVYRAHVNGVVNDASLKKLAEGVVLPDGNIGKAEGAIDNVENNTTVLQLTLTEGRKREVKHLCQGIGHGVLALERVSFAGLDCTGLEVGKWRELTADEIAGLRKLVKLS